MFTTFHSLEEIEAAAHGFDSYTSQRYCDHLLDAEDLGLVDAEHNGRPSNLSDEGAAIVVEQMNAYLAGEE